MAANHKPFKFFFNFFVSFLLLFILSQNSFSAIYEWEDYSKIFNKKTELMCHLKPTHIKVYLPKIIKNYESITLIALIEADPARFLPREYLIVNNYDREKYSIKPNVHYRIKIHSKHLKAGINILEFISTADWCSYGSIVRELRFDFSGIEDIKAHIDEKQSSAKIAIKKPISPEQEPQKDTTPPEIIISSHDTSRGIKPLQNQKKARISGRAYDENGIVEITVNNKDTIFDEAGNFETDVYLKMGKNRIVVNAMDIYENRARKEFTITRVASQTPAKAKVVKATAGRHFALVIGNDNYKYLRKLTTAKKDAEQVGALLKRRYGFDIRLLLDVTRIDIVSALNRYRMKLRQDDSFLIYYAGHGEFDKVTNKAYWLPVDARSGEDTNWIIVDTITSNIKRIPCRHILIIADSCYSGTFTRRAVTELISDQERKRYLRKMQAKRSRTLLASGGNEPVSDIGGKGHSVFAKALLHGLASIEYKEFTAEELYYRHIKEMVAGSSEQTPEYNIIRNSGHEGGDFIFKRKN
jgi:hypothetical protein